MVSVDRMRHCCAVAEYMRDYVKCNAENCEVRAEDAYMVGLLHDIGYGFMDGPGHASMGGLMLRRNSFEYWKEVYFHGSVSGEYESEMLDLLNNADLHVDGHGNQVSFELRLNDIKNRYGEDSAQFKNALALVQKLKKKGFE